MKITNGMMHPEIRLAGMIIRTFFNVKKASSLYKVQALVEKARGFMKPKGLRSAEVYVKTPDNPRLRLCIYSSPKPKPDAVGLLWLHGGGYAIGTPEQDLGFIRRFIEAANCVVVAPDYRLSVQEPYPAAICDCYNALLWMKKRAAKLGIRADQIFCGGESAGGGLTAAVSLAARDRGEVNIACQMPFYPMLDDRLVTPSSKDNDGPITNTQAVKAAWKLYLGNLYGTDRVPAYAAPARAINYAGLPPTYTFVGDIDLFVDETKEYINNLRKAGVKARLDIYPGGFHGFDIICGKSNIARKAQKRYIAFFKYAVENYFAPQA